MFGKARVAFQQIGRNVVGGKDTIAFVDFGIDALSYCFQEFLGGQVFVVLYPLVDAGCQLVVHTSFLAKDTHPHVVKIVLLRLFEGGIVAF